MKLANLIKTEVDSVVDSGKKLKNFFMNTFKAKKMHKLKKNVYGVGGGYYLPYMMGGNYATGSDNSGGGEGGDAGGGGGGE